MISHQAFCCHIAEEEEEDIKMDAEEKEWRKGPWTPEEDKLLSEYVKVHGEGRWTSVATGSRKNIFSSFFFPFKLED